MAVANPISLPAGIEDYRRAISDAREAFEETYEALRGFQLMLGSTLEEYSNSSQFNYGISALLRHQLDSLKEVRRDVFTLVDWLAEAAESQDRPAPQETLTPEARLVEAIRREILAAADRPAWHDLDTIAARARVRKCDLARVMFVLTGEDHTGPAYRAWDGNLSDGVHAHLLAGLCASALSHGDMLGKVSTATDLEIEKIEAVLRALLEYTPKRERVSQEPFAEVKAAQAEDMAMRARIAEQDADRPSAQAIVKTLDQLRAANLGEIARDTNLKEETIRRVLDRLLDYPAPDERPAVSNG